MLKRAALYRGAANTFLNSEHKRRILVCIRSSSAIGANGTLYFGCGGGNIYAVGTDGVLKWKFPTGASDILASPLIDSEGTLYCGASDTYLYALNPDGTLRWKYKTDGNIEASVAIGAERTIYIAVGRTLYALGE